MRVGRTREADLTGARYLMHDVRREWQAGHGYAIALLYDHAN